MNRWLLVSFVVITFLIAAFLRNSMLPLKYVSSQEPTRYEKEEVSSAKPILFAGDVMLGRYVETLSLKAGNEMLPFKETEWYLKQHVTIVNLEGPIPARHVPTPINGFSFSFPPSAPRILKSAGITAVSLANNHMFDYGKSGYEDTKRALESEGIAHFGGYSPTESDYYQTKLGTTTVIVYGVTMIARGWDESQAIELTKKLRSGHPDAYLIAFLHWGDEYVTQNKYQRAFAHELINNGVDAIIGSHPHVVQGIEIYNGKPVFYSLGNFVFDQYWRSDVEDGFLVELSKKNSSYEYGIVPIHSVRSVPHIATSTERDRILEKVSSQSENSLRTVILQGRLFLQNNP